MICLLMSGSWLWNWKPSSRYNECWVDKMAFQVHSIHASVAQCKDTEALTWKREWVYNFKPHWSGLGMGLFEDMRRGGVAGPNFSCMRGICLGTTAIDFAALCVLKWFYFISLWW